MRGIPSLITDIRKKVFVEVARMAYAGNGYEAANELPYKIVPGDRPLHRESAFLERAIAGERDPAVPLGGQELYGLFGLAQHYEDNDLDLLILGGVTIDHPLGLLGHSDADVLLHAISDALLGAAALGDIGKHFPDKDPAYKDADSLLLLRRVGMLLDRHGYRVSNIDSTVLAQAPKLAPHIQEMRLNIAKALNLDIALVSVKATTEEGLGFTGEQLGIAAHAVCLIESVR